MTVCVAAMCAINTIFGASDRMLTAGDIQFEPEQPKIYPVSNSIAVQVAGDASIQEQIMQAVFRDVGKRIQEAPDEWRNVRDVAELYRRHYQELRLAHAEHDILAPLGLDRNTWLTKQKEMDSGLVIKIATELMNYEWQGTAAIVSGVDTTGAHIYTARDGAISCEDSVGFAAIGAGEGHADSQLMFDRHDRHKSIPETLLLVYSAKKRAEVAPGVGEDTDMFSVGPGLGTFAAIPPDILDGLGDIYQAEQERHREAAETAKGEVTKYVEKLTKEAAEQAQTTKPLDGGGDTSPNS
ncbi:MAG: hypothetical protein V3R87_00545 [Dehalococcoidia bacterium]